MRKWVNGKRGFTLIELMVSAAIVAIGTVALLSAFLSGLILIESSRNMAVAAADARSIFEEMRRVSRSGLGWVTATNWTTWAQTNGLTSLPQERITVQYKNPLYDLLEVGLTVSWVEHSSRNRSVIFNNLVTERY